MRGPEDLVVIDVTLKSRISLDRERIVNDPAWAVIADHYDLTDSQQIQEALYQYVSIYLIRQQIFGGQTVFMPSTNGPADIQIIDMEDVSNGDGNSGGNRS